MVINLQGIKHFQDGINYQDLAIETSKLILVLDGCTKSKSSEVGIRLFCELFSTLPGYEDVEKFEENVKFTFERMIEQLKVWFDNAQKLDKFIDRNLLFTIIACFNTEDAYVVKTFGDGYIITVNSNNDISYIKLNYGEKPPYYAYKYCSYDEAQKFKDYEVKTFVFSKDKFKFIGASTDGIKLIVENELYEYDKLIKNREGKAVFETEIRMDSNRFFDDVTLGIFYNGGKLDGKNN